MYEPEPEKVQLPSDGLLYDWKNLNRTSLEKDIEILKARERARLTVLDLTGADKRFLKSLKIAV